MRVMVLGDVIIDRYTHGSKLGISAETPTIVGKFQKEETFVGGAGLVCRNLLRLGAQVSLMTPHTYNHRDFDGMTALLRDSSDPITHEEEGKFRDHGPTFNEWKHVEKRRYFVDRYKLLQYDVLNDRGYEEGEEDTLIELIEKELKTPYMSSWGPYHAMVICDNRHGTMTRKIAESVVKICKKSKVHLYIDSQVSQKTPNHSWYSGANTILVNEYESDMIAKTYGINSNIGDIGEFLASDMIYKRGDHGAVSVPLNGKCQSDSGFEVDAIDTCGAGDAFLAAYVMHGNLEAANRWAALSTTYKGTIVPKLTDLKKVTR